MQMFNNNLTFPYYEFETGLRFRLNTFYWHTLDRNRRERTLIPMMRNNNSVHLKLLCLYSIGITGVDPLVEFNSSRERKDKSEPEYLIQLNIT